MQRASGSILHFDDAASLIGGRGRKGATTVKEARLLDHLFVYGTLMATTRHPMAHRLRSESVAMGHGAIQAKLFHLGRYPAAVPSNAPGDIVYGEVVRLLSPERSLAWLDEYEGCAVLQPRPHSYKRAIVNVRLITGEQRRAWGYFYNLPVRLTRLLPRGRFR